MASSVVTLTETPSVEPAAPSSSRVPVVTEIIRTPVSEPLVRDPQKGKAVQTADVPTAVSSGRPSVADPSPQSAPSSFLPSSLSECMAEVYRMSKLSFDDVDFGQYSKLLEHTLISFPEIAPANRDNLKNSLRLARKIERELPIQRAAQAEARATLQSLPDPVAIRADLEAQLADARERAEAAHIRKNFTLAELTGYQKSLSLKEDQLALLDRSLSLIGPDGRYTEEAITEKAAHHALYFKHQHFSHAAEAIMRTLDSQSDKYKRLMDDLTSFVDSHLPREDPSDAVE